MLAQESARIRKEFDKAMAEGNTSEVNYLGQVQRRNGALASVKSALQGGNPALESSPENAFTHPAIEVIRRAFHVEQMEGQVQDVLAGPEWQQVQAWYRNVEQQYRDHNESLLGTRKPGMTDQELLEIQKKLLPIEVDPNEAANMRQMMVKVNQQMQDISGGTMNLWNHPGTARVATFMNRETAIGTPGYLRSGGQSLPAFTEYVVRPYVEGLTTLTDPVFNLIYGGYGWVGESIGYLSNGQAGWEAPTNFVEMPDGTVMTNAGRLPGSFDMFVAMHAKLAGNDVGKAVASWNAAREYGEANANGFGELLTGVSQVAGVIAGFAPTAAAGAGITNNINKGLRWMGALGKVGKGAQATGRARAIMFFTGATGQASAFALHEAIASGKPEKLLESLGHGAQTGLLMHAIGSMGKGVERFARRKNMPARVAQGLALTTEALGFTTLSFADMEGSMWKFIKDPSAETWADYGKEFAKNWLGLLLGKGLGARLGDAPRPANLSLGASAARRLVADKIRALREAGKEVPAELRREVERMGTDVEQLEQLSQVATRARAGDTEAAVERMRVERQLEAQEVGVGRSEVEGIREDVGRVERAPQATLEGQRAQLELLAQQGPTRANRAKLIQMMEAQRGELAMAAGEALQRITPQGPPTRAERTTGDVVRAETEAGLGSFRAQQELLRAPEVAGTKPVRKSDIFARMQGFEGDPVRTPQRKGKIRFGKSTKGFLDRNKDLIRFRGETELAERAHEFSHAIQEAAIGLADKALPPEAKAEANEMLEGYGGRDRLSREQVYAEAWAEYHARDLLGEQGMAEQFPVLSKLFAEALASRPQVLRQFAEVKELFERYRNIGDFERGRQFIHALGDRPSPEAIAAFRAQEGGPIRRFFRRANEWFFQDIERLSYSLEKWSKIAGIDPSTVPINMHITRTIETLRGTEAARAANFMEEGVLRAGERGQSLKDALAEVKTPEQRDAMMVYLAARKMWEMNKKGLETFFPKESILRMMDQAAARFGDLVSAERVSRKVKAFFDDLVGWTADEGMLTRMEADTMIADWSSYTPFQRYYEQAMRSGLGTGGGLRKIKGGIEEIADPFEAMVQVSTSLVRQVHRFKSLDALYQMGLKFKGLGGLVNEVPPDQLPKEFQVEEVLRAIEKQVDLPGDRQHELEFTLDQMREILGEDAAVNLMLFRPNYQGNRNRPILMHRTSAGKRLWLEVDKGAFEAIQAVENTIPAVRAVATLESLGRTLRLPTGVVRFFATGVNLEFAARNTFRDAALFPGYSKVSRSLLPWSGLAYWARGVKRLLASGKDSDMAEINSLFRSMGGEGLSFFAREIRRKRGSEQLLPKGARIGEEYTPRGLLNRARGILESTIGKVVDIGERSLRFEEFSEVYKKSVAEGKSQSEAALEALEGAKEVTINFTRAGILSRQLNQIIPYFNASMQGMRKTFRAFSGVDGDRAMKVSWANLGSTVAGMTALQHWWHGDEQWFQDLAPWQRFATWHFQVGDQILEIPKPHLPAYAVTSMFDQLFSDNKLDAKDVLGEGMDQLLWDHLGLPSFVLPFIEWGANYSFWKEKPLVPNWLERSKVGPEQFNAYTAGWAKWMSKVANDTFGVEFSPIKLENFANQATGSLPAQLERHIGGLGNALGFELDPDRKETLDQVPILSSMLRHYAHRGSKAVTDFYDIKNQLERKAGSDKLDPTQRPMLEEARNLRERLNSIRVLRDQGTLSREDAARMSYEVVAPFVKRQRR